MKEIVESPKAECKSSKCYISKAMNAASPQRPATSRAQAINSLAICKVVPLITSAL